MRKITIVGIRESLESLDMKSRPADCVARQSGDGQVVFVMLLVCMKIGLVGNVPEYRQESAPRSVHSGPVNQYLVHRFRQGREAYASRASSNDVEKSRTHLIGGGLHWPLMKQSRDML